MFNVTRITYVKYEYPSPYRSKVMAKVKKNHKYGKLQGQGQKVKVFSIQWKVMPKNYIFEAWEY